MGQEGGVEALRATNDHWLAAGATELRFETIAIRDDVLALTRNTIVTTAGDELVVLTITELGSTGRVQRLTSFEPDQILDRILDAITAPIQLDSGEHAVAASIGAVDFRFDGDLDQAIGAADQAMYEAKRRGRGRWHRGDIE